MKRLRVIANLVVNSAIVASAICLMCLTYEHFSDSKKVVKAQHAVLTVDQKVDLQSLPKDRDTLVLALQIGCHFCKESMPFYRTVIAAASNKGAHITAVLPSKLDDSFAYLRESDLPIADVRSLNLSSMNVAGTPTVILLSPNAQVEKFWVGELSAREQQDVLKSL